MLNKILIPTDFSPKSLCALEMACTIAMRSKAKIELLYIVEIALSLKQDHRGRYISTVPAAQAFVDQVYQTAFARLIQQRELVSQYPVDIELKVEMHNDPSKLVSFLVQHDYDLLILGGKTIRKYDELFESTQRELLTEFSKFPIMAINQEMQHYRLKKLLLTTNFQQDLSKVIKWIKDFRHLLEAQLYILYVNTPTHFLSSREIQIKSKEFVRKYGLEKAELVLYNDRRERFGILNYADDIDADLIITFTNNTQRIHRILKGNLTEDLVNHSLRPVLTFNLKRLAD
ncbi:universal stress protein [Rapidithrix thailandica]|uniref:Universal stress protein n=1 Tax=Rapidithrix thailandica TaxID=413964 RepID=A0AAW9S292_9BACT